MIPCQDCLDHNNYDHCPQCGWKGGRMYDRITQWRKFSEQMERHIVAYTLDQYGNKEGNEQVDTFTVEDIWVNVNRYYNRRKSMARGPKEKLRDAIKVAHYMSFLYDKLKDELGEPDVYPSDVPRPWGLGK